MDQAASCRSCDKEAMARSYEQGRRQKVILTDKSPDSYTTSATDRKQEMVRGCCPTQLKSACAPHNSNQHVPRRKSRASYFFAMYQTPSLQRSIIQRARAGIIRLVEGAEGHLL